MGECQKRPSTACLDCPRFDDCPVQQKLTDQQVTRRQEAAERALSRRVRSGGQPMPNILGVKRGRLTK